MSIKPERFLPNPSHSCTVLTADMVVILVDSKLLSAFPFIGHGIPDNNSESECITARRSRRYPHSEWRGKGITRNVNFRRYLQAFHPLLEFTASPFTLVAIPILVI
jgi:hypothetical protein